MKNYILLKKDSSVETLQIDKKIPFKECAYVLIPIDEFALDAFVAIEPNSTWKKFKRAKIVFEIVISASNLEYESICDKSILNETKKEFTNISDTINYLHSLNRIRYINMLANGAENGEYAVMNFSKFSINIYDKHDDVVYEYTFTGGLNNQLGPEDILHKIKFLYNPIFPNTERYLKIINDTWIDSKNFKDIYAVYGIKMSDTKSLFFLSQDALRVFKSIKSLNTGSYQYNEKECIPMYKVKDIVVDYESTIIDDVPEEYAFRFHDIWTHVFEDIIEYLVYLNTIYNHMITVTEYENYNMLTGNIVMSAWACLESNNIGNADIEFDFTHENIPAINDIAKLIHDKWVIE